MCEYAGSVGEASESPGTPQGAIMDIFKAIRRGHEDYVSRLLDAHPTLLETEDYLKGGWYRPLHWAAVNGRVGVVRLLVQRGANIHAIGHQRRTALHDASHRGYEDIVALLLGQGAQANNADMHGWTPLMSAAWFGYLGVANVLLKHMEGQGLNWTDDEGRTALYRAAWAGHEEIVRALLLAGADFNIADNQGRTALAIAGVKGHQGCVDCFNWWEGELERPYTLHRARCLHDAVTKHQATPTAPVSAYIHERTATGQALPQVEVVARQQEEEQQAGASGKRKASSEACRTEDEEEKHALLAYVVGQLNEQLFTELMQGFHA